MSLNSEASDGDVALNEASCATSRRGAGHFHSIPHCLCGSVRMFKLHPTPSERFRAYRLSGSRRSIRRGTSCLLASPRLFRIAEPSTLGRCVVACSSFTFTSQTQTHLGARRTFRPTSSVPPGLGRGTCQRGSCQGREAKSCPSVYVPLSRIGRLPITMAAASSPWCEASGRRRWSRQWT